MPTDIHIHSPREVALALHTARYHNINVCRALAIRYFAGLRSAEVDRIDESQIKLDQGVIEVTAAMAKTRSRRLVTIQPVLREWLELGGTLPLGDAGNRIRLFIKALKTTHEVQWNHNVTRHSFVSYHLAQFENASKTALEAGHSETMLFRHYRALVLKADAEEFWKLTPAKSEEIAKEKI